MTIGRLEMTNAVSVTLRAGVLLATTILPDPCPAQTWPCPPVPQNAAGGSPATTGCGTAGNTLAGEYPGDAGMADAPDVLWYENFEGRSLSAIIRRYDDANNPGGMSLITGGSPAKSRGTQSIRMVSSGAGPHATDLFKNFGTGYDEFYIRYYVKYQRGGPWHHTGVWFGGYNPPRRSANPQAGTKPSGSDRFSIAVEPVESGTNVRLDYYNYWMGMHSWMASPSGGTAYYGNSMIQDTALRAPDDAWVCLEVHAKLNTTLSSSAGAELEVWLNDRSMQRLTGDSMGYWVRDKFCPENTSGTQCTDYRSFVSAMAPVNLQFRSVGALRLNYIWIQNYISEGGSGSVWYDDLVVAKRRIGCLQ